MFLLPAMGSVYMFVQARDNEIIKKIERATMSVTEIRDALNANDSIGFASFVCFQDDHLAIGSTVLAPRIMALNNYINEMLLKLGTDLLFEIRPMTYTLPKAEIQRLTHVGAFSMKVQAGNRVWDTVVASLGGGDRDDLDIGSIEVTVRPAKARGDNRRALAAAVESVGEKGLESFDARAKIDIADRMTDVFIVGAGGIRDPIDTSREETIADQIVQATTSNTVLGERLREFRQDTDISHVPDPADLDLSWPPASIAGLGTDEGPP